MMLRPKETRLRSALRLVRGADTLRILKDVRPTVIFVMPHAIDNINAAYDNAKVSVVNIAAKIVKRLPWLFMLNPAQRRIEHHPPTVGRRSVAVLGGLNTKQDKLGVGLPYADGEC